MCDRCVELAKAEAGLARYKPMPCNDCGKDTGPKGLQEYYMIGEQYWDQVAKPNEILCIGCLEKRADGERLPPHVFTGYPLNYDQHFKQSKRLMSRIGGLNEDQLD